MVDRPALAEAEALLEQPYDTADPVAVNAARKKDGRKKRDRLSTMQGMMDVKDVRAWLYSVLDAAHVFATSFNHDPYVTAFREGERNIGLRVLADIQDAAPAKYITMIEEAKGRV